MLWRKKQKSSQQDAADGAGWFRALVLEADEARPFFQTCWAPADHLGTAIARILDSGRQKGMKHPRVRECAPCGPDDATEDTVEGHGGVRWPRSRHAFPPEPVFAFPQGIVPSGQPGEFDIDEIRAGCNLTAESGLSQVIANVEADALLNRYEDLLRLFPAFEVFWIVLHAHWEDAGADLFLVNPALNSADAILDFLRDIPLDTVQNGFVTLTAYHDDGETNVSLTEHKRLAVTTRSPEIAERCVAALERAGLPVVDDLPSVQFGVHHWHYRLPGSRDRNSLDTALKKQGFSPWDPEAPA